jgi:hypothetical protein
MKWKPRRKIRPTRGRNYRSKITRSKGFRIIHAESLLERDAVRLFNFNVKIVSIRYQPIGIKYLHQGTMRRYFPDYQLRTKEGHTIIVEVKLTKYVNTEKNKAKILAAKIHCREMGWTFIVMTEKDIRKGHLQYNIKMLNEVKCFAIEPAIVEYIKTILKQYGLMSVKELRDKCSFIEPDLITIKLHKLLYNREVSSDLITQRFNEKSMIWLKEEL